MSAGRGGKNAGSGGKEGLFAGDRMDELTEQAKAMVRAGRGRELMLMPGWWYVISAESFLDRIESVPDILANAPKIKCPVLTLRGDKEDGERYPAEQYGKVAGGPCKVEIISSCDHFYNGREDHVAKVVADWLTQTLKI